MHILVFHRSLFIFLLVGIFEICGQGGDYNRLDQILEPISYQEFLHLLVLHGVDGDLVILRRLQKSVESVDFCNIVRNLIGVRFANFDSLLD